MSKKQTLVVIGNGMVGQYFLATLMASESKGDYHVVTFCEEPIPAYDRVHLNEYFAGKSAADLSLVEVGFFDANQIMIHLGDRAVSIDNVNKTVRSEKGVEVHHDKLVLATGSKAFIPPIPEHDRENCIPYRTIADLPSLAKKEQPVAPTMVIIGEVVKLHKSLAWF
jgi:nitrite reductase (NADH) large subunit